MLHKIPLFFTILFLFAIPASLAQKPISDGILAQEQIHTFINYQDLVELSKTENPQGELFKKYQKQLLTPIVKQPQDISTEFLHDQNLGSFFRVAHWNIERGFNSDKVSKVFASRGKYLTGGELNKELNDLSLSDVVVLNEVDYGVPRTGYENITEKIAKSLGYGYIFAPEFLEVDPYQLGVKKFTADEKVYLEKGALEQLENLQKDKYLGLHGSAILTKYPILSAKVIRLPNCYGWYVEESRKLSALEFVRRGAADKVFSAKVLTELRHGSRMAIVADLLLPSNQVVTIVGTHLENRCLPQCRLTQFQHLLNRLITVRNPLIIAGDFNTTGTDSSPVAVKKEILKKVKDPEFVAKQALLAVTPVGLVENLTFSLFNKIRQYRDPTKKDIPILLPNKEGKIFEILKEFTFSDGGMFDVRGIPEKSYNGKAGFLSNSNQKAIKGYAETFELPRALGVGKFKLDWFFVKPHGLTLSNNNNGSYTFAPHFGRTLKLANTAFSTIEEPISDHYPIIVDIPLQDPRLLTTSSQ